MRGKKLRGRERDKDTAKYVAVWMLKRSALEGVLGRVKIMRTGNTLAYVSPMKSAKMDISRKQSLPCMLPFYTKQRRRWLRVVSVDK